MGNVYRCGAIAAKLRAKRARLLTEEQLRELAFCKNSEDMLHALEQFPRYAALLEGKSPEALRRAPLERLLMSGQFRDFISLYRFAGAGQRPVLELELRRLEALLLKRYLRAVFGHAPSPDPAPFASFFRKHGGVDFPAAAAAADLSAFADALRGSAYAPLFPPLLERGGATLPECELALDLYCFRLLRRQAEKTLSKADASIFLTLLELRADLLNLQWIRRAKKYYRMSSENIRALLIPVRERRRREELEAFLSAGTGEDVLSLMRGGRWEAFLRRFPRAAGDIEWFSELVLACRELSLSRSEPYSCAPIIAYLRELELETRRIINLAEAVRYGLPGEQIISEIWKLNDRRSTA